MRTQRQKNDSNVMENHHECSKNCWKLKKVKMLSWHPAGLSKGVSWLQEWSIFTIFSRVHATLQPALSISRLVSWWVGWSVGWSVTLYFFYDFISFISLLLPKWSGDLKYGPCPPARDFGSRVSGLVIFILSVCWSVGASARQSVDSSVHRSVGPKRISNK